MAKVIEVSSDDLVKEIINLVAKHGHPEKLIKKQWCGNWDKNHVIQKINGNLFLLGAKPYEDCCARCAEGDTK